jgi:hypothetical protein
MTWTAELLCLLDLTCSTAIIRDSVVEQSTKSQRIMVLRVRRFERIKEERSRQRYLQISTIDHIFVCQRTNDTVESVIGYHLDS